ncbi:hypothetical protein HHL16_09180 [Pseudoflavitalea sp. G-6-1-2]|uniref:hypothetical protein n=1 Tax=Pseudoflavitalea sp. G-6-1-2 TaxID=2728841 RepID=UPI00146F123B|nr:hypothetical protein [Pseudoflavitalea sp. G-6-1-2]NML21044.1 hypothetical protein [Pseudoflavitalea sp. G-6-1-2]
MRRLIALLCFVCFFAIQYGRIMSYWECRLMANSTAARCDCEKLIAKQADAKGNFSVSVQQKIVSEDVYEHSYHLLPELSAAGSVLEQTQLLSAPLPEGNDSGILRPPRC